MSHTSLIGLLVLLAILAVATVAIADVLFVYHVYHYRIYRRWRADDGTLASLALSLWVCLATIATSLCLNVAHPLTTLLTASTLTNAIQYWLTALVLLICVGGLVVINCVAIYDAIHPVNDLEE